MKIKTSGYFIVCPNGDIGLAVDDKPHPVFPDVTVVVVQFGSDGPFKPFKESVLRYATVDEVKEAGLYGVGGSFGP